MRVVACWLALASAGLAQQYVFHAYRQPEGLKNLAVSAMTTDRNGFLWVVTENGVYRFLGSSFERFGPEQGIGEVDVHDVVADPDGAVWVGTAENVYRWDGQRFWPAGNGSIHILGPRRMAVEDASHLLVVDGTRLYRLEHDRAGRTLSYQPVLSDRMVQAEPGLGRLISVSLVREPPHGLRIWMGGGGKLYSLADRPSAGPPQPENAAVTEWGKERGLPADNWEDVLLDRAGTLWAAGQNRVAVLTRDAERFAERNIPSSDPGNVSGHAPLIEDREGRILAPAEGGVARWDGAAWRIIGRDNGLERTSRIAGMAIDAAGDLWLASHGQGVYSWAGYEDWEGWSDRQRLPSAAVWAIVPSPQGRVFIGTEGGPAWVDPRSGASGPLSQGGRWTYGQIAAMYFDRQGALFAGTFSGAIVRIDPQTGRAEQTAKIPAFIIRTLVDASGRVFFCTKQGLYVLDPPASSQKRASKANERLPVATAPHRVPAVDALLGMPNRVESACAAPGGDLWFLANNRILRLKDGLWSEPPIDGRTRLRGSLLALSCAPDGAVWITGEQAGTWRLMPGSGRVQAWQLVLPASLRSLTPLAILVDRRGWVWLGTDLGLVAWNGRNWRHLTQESGLIWNDTDQGSLQTGPDGSLWIGTSGGLSHLLHPEHVFEPVALAVSVTDMGRGAEHYLPERQITLPWAHLPLTFRVSSPATRNRSELTFQFWMVGLHPDWIESQDGTAVFSNLPPGDYIFKAKASNAGLSAYSAPVEVAVRILPPWWLSSWLYALYGLTLLLLLVSINRLYARHLRARSRELEGLIRERTRELEVSREELRIQAAHDGLTGMLNRTAVLRALAAEMERARRESRTVVVALVDLDNFKRINDAYGHLAGDEALRWFGAAVGAAIRVYDHAGRYGGEEFLLVLTEVPRQAAEERLIDLHAAISNLEIHAREARFGLNCSMGAVVYDPCEEPGTAESLLAVADQALYVAKATGRNRMVLHPAVSTAGQSPQPSQHAFS